MNGNISGVERIAQNAYKAYITRIQSAEPMQPEIAGIVASGTGYVGILVEISDEARRKSKELQRTYEIGKVADDKTVTRIQPPSSVVYGRSNIIRKSDKSPAQEAAEAYALRQKYKAKGILEDGHQVDLKA